MTVISELHAQEYRSTHTGHRRHQSRRVGLYLVLRESARERPLDSKSKKDHTVGGENPGERRWEGLFFSSSEISDVSSVGRGAVISRPEEGKRFFPAAYPSTRDRTLRQVPVSVQSADSHEAWRGGCQGVEAWTL